MKQRIKRWLEKRGYRLQRLSQTWSPWGGRIAAIDDDEFQEVFLRAETDPAHRSRLKDAVNSKICRCWMLQSLLRTLPLAEGHIAECGVNRGLSAYVTAYYLRQLRFGATHQFHLFDSFEGLPAPDPRVDNPTTAAGLYPATIEHVAEHLKEFSFVRLHKGWIPQSLEAVRDLQFRFVHIDLNLYQSYQDSLNFFWPRLLAPGLIVFDDYGFPGSCGARQAVDEFGAAAGVHPVYLPTGQAVVWKLEGKS